MLPTIPISRTLFYGKRKYELNQIPNMEGTVSIVTGTGNGKQLVVTVLKSTLHFSSGGNSGLGFVTAKEIARKGLRDSTALF